MATIKTSWLRASILFSILVFGVFFAVKALEVAASESQTQNWFIYTGADQSLGEIENPDNYQLADEQPPCEGGTELCSIAAANDGNDRPVLSSPLVNHILSTIQTREPSESVKLQN
ncbi:hypothetical protein [Sphingobacterium deserti]|uniref:Uncharacterized protein n=1 Tax=Sphingobacterium deserti TaxID=1229276 RepID=A0A0B8T057_9SPHI|nr:hypothetical protein [Sphingobacterium deserti]KGE13526.1 hypothetical protein DI53_2714 [Sphingobacterium deserti]